MKRVVLAWIGILLLVGLAGAGYVYLQNSRTAESQNTQARQNKTQTDSSEVTPSDSKAEQASAQPGVYEDYQEGLVASTNGVKVLFFHAPWCPQCRMIEADIESDGVPDGVTILKVDYDSNQPLRQKYGVTLQTTFVEIDNDGNEIETFVAYNEPTFDSVKANLLNE